MQGNQLRFRQFFEQTEARVEVGTVQATVPFGSLAAAIQLDRAIRQLAASSPTYNGPDPLGDYIQGRLRKVE